MEKDFLPYKDLYIDWQQEFNITPEAEKTLDFINHYLREIIKLHKQWKKLCKPPHQEIQVWEHIVYQSLLREARAIYRTYEPYETQTEEQLESRHQDFTKHIQPYVIFYSKIIYSIIKK